MLRLFLLYGLSGFVSLGYQVAWFRICVDRFGSTNLTFALVVCNFIGGLGAGALASARVRRGIGAALRLRDGLRVYGLVELLVTVTVGFTLLLVLLPGDAWGVFPYREAGGMFVPTPLYALSHLALAVACVFVPCFFMGVTFPLLCDVHRGLPGTERFPSALYAWNTLGACTGVLAALFVFLPWLGHDRMLWLLAGLNLALGAYFLVAGGAPGRAAAPEPEAAGGNLPLLLTCAVLSGLLAGALEGDMFKRIDFITTGTAAVMALISFWAILAIFLAAAAVRLVPGMGLGWIKAAWAAGLGAYVLAWVSEGGIRDLFRPPAGVREQAETLGLHWGVVNSLGESLLFVGIFVFPAYFAVSLLLPWVCNRLHAGRRHLGLAYGANTLAFCAGLIAFTHIAPRVSIFYSLKLMVVLFAVAAGLLLTLFESRRVAWRTAVAAAAVVVACLAVPRGFDPDYMYEGRPDAPVRALKSNGAHTTFVQTLPEGDVLYFNRYVMASTTHGSHYARLMAHVPLLAHPDPRRALLICYGAGLTASAIAAHDTIEEIDAVELNPRVIETAPEFADATNAVHEDPRIRFIVDDGRSFLARTDRRYDLVTSEPPPPMQAGVYRLYTVDYYREVLDHLTPHGLMTQWIPSHMMPEEAVVLAIRSFVSVFPHAMLYAGGRREFILMGSPSPIDLGNLERRFHDQPRVAADLRRMAITRPLALLARFVNGDRTLRGRFGGGRVLRDTGNDFEFVFDDPDRAIVIDYEPFELLAELEGLAEAEELRGVLTHLGRLRYHVRDYPMSSLAAARRLADRGVRYAHTDWARVERTVARAAALLTEGDAAGAQSMLREALEIAAEQPLLLLLVAQTRLRTGDAAGAEAALLDFLAIEPREEEGHRLLGIALWAQGRREEALTRMREAVRVNPWAPTAQQALGSALVRTGRVDEGILHLRRALEIEPASEDTQRLLDAALRLRRAG